MAGYNGKKMNYKGVKPYNSAGKPNYQKAPKANLYKGFRKDATRGELPAEEKLQLRRREGRAPNEKLYQMPNDRYTNGQLPDTKTPPPAKPGQKYGVRDNSVSFKNYGNKRVKATPEGKKFMTTNKMPKGKPIKSIADLKGRVKAGAKKVKGSLDGGY